MRLQDGVDLLFEVSLGLVADDPIRRFAAAEQDQTGDAEHAELRCRQRVSIDVELGDRDPTGVLDGQLLDDRSEHLAWRAPGRPEIEEHELLRSADGYLEILIRDLDDVLGCHFSPRLGARLLFCFSRRRRRRRRAAAFRGVLGLGVDFPVGFGVDLRGIRWGDASVARRSPRVCLVEAATLENDADRVKDARHRRPAFGALRQGRFGDSLLDLEMVTAAAAVSVDGHMYRPNLYPDSGRQKTPESSQRSVDPELAFRP